MTKTFWYVLSVHDVHIYKRHISERSDSETLTLDTIGQLEIVVFKSRFERGDGKE